MKMYESCVSKFMFSAMYFEAYYVTSHKKPSLKGIPPRLFDREKEMEM